MLKIDKTNTSRENRELQVDRNATSMTRCKPLVSAMLPGVVESETTQAQRRQRRKYVMTNDLYASRILPLKSTTL